MQRNNDTSSSGHAVSSAGAIWLKMAVLYLIGGIALGIAMGASQNFAMRPVHAHLNLLGWATMALAGLIYTVFPRAGESRLATIHFWLHNTALPAMMGSLALLLLGHTEVVPVLAASEIVAAAGVLVFACNIFVNVGRSDGRYSARAATPEVDPRSTARAMEPAAGAAWKAR